MARSAPPKHSNAESPAYLPTITVPDVLSGATWKPLDASQAAESLKSSRQQVDASPAHLIIASIRAEAMCPPEASGMVTRLLRSWLIVECRCGSRRAVQKMDIRKAIRRGQWLYCSPACMAETFSGAQKTRFCACGAYIPLSRRSTCSDVCAKAQRSHPIRMCPQCSGAFRPKSSRTMYCSRSCANLAHSRRMIGRGNSHFKTGTSYSHWFRSMRPLILQRDHMECVVCAASPTLTFARAGKTVQRSALVIHHIDEDVRNNRPENLITLCLTCHTVHHKSKKTPYPWFANEAKKRSRSMTSKWTARATSLVTAYSSTTAS